MDNEKQEKLQDETIVKKDTQARDWVFVVNNPKLTELEMSDYLKTLVNVRYFIFAREKGDGTDGNPEGTEHHQGYIEFTAPKRFSTMKHSFSVETVGVNAHIKPRLSKRINNVNYVKKIGKHADKAHTRISEIFEFGEFVGDGERTDIMDMVKMKVDGISDCEVFESFTNSYARYNRFVSEMAFTYKAEKFATLFRANLEVYYLYGLTRTGKTRYALDKYGYANVYKNQGYIDGKWFDGYSGQDVLLLDEYRSSFDFGMLLQYLDKQPVTIQCRYKNKQACYTKVYITSNIPLFQQHKDIQMSAPRSWEALLERITGILHFDGKGIKEEPIPNRKRPIVILPPLSDEEAEGLPF